jgi:hypothetical protein
MSVLCQSPALHQRVQPGEPEPQRLDARFAGGRVAGKAPELGDGSYRLPPRADRLPRGRRQHLLLHGRQHRRGGLVGCRAGQVGQPEQPPRHHITDRHRMLQRGRIIELQPFHPQAALEGEVQPLDPPALRVIAQQLHRRRQVRHWQGAQQQPADRRLPRRGLLFARFHHPDPDRCPRRRPCSLRVAPVVLGHTQLHPHPPQREDRCPLRAPRLARHHQRHLSQHGGRRHRRGQADHRGGLVLGRGRGRRGFQGQDFHPPGLAGPHQQVRVRPAGRGQVIVHVRFPIRQHQQCLVRREGRFDAGQPVQPLAALLLRRGALLARVLLAVRGGIAGPKMQIDQSQRQAVGRQRQGRMRQQAAAVGIKADGSQPGGGTVAAVV